MVKYRAVGWGSQERKTPPENFGGAGKKHQQRRLEDGLVNSGSGNKIQVVACIYETRCARLIWVRNLGARIISRVCKAGYRSNVGTALPKHFALARHKSISKSGR
jgi:hypothetical protein